MYFIQDIDIVATYSDTSGAIRLGRVKMKDLSASWMWDNPIDGNHGRQRNFQVLQRNNLLVKGVISLIISCTKIISLSPAYLKETIIW